MSVTVADLIIEFDKRLGDASTDRVTAAQRLTYLTQGTIWLQERVMNDHQVKKYTINYFDSLHYYKTTTILDDLLEGNDLNTHILTDDGQPFARKSSQELRAEIGSNFMESSYSIERENSQTYLVINHDSKYRALVLSSCESLTDNGTWAADTSGSDMSGLTIDNDDFSEGSGSFKFNLTVAQSGNNKATMSNSTLSAEDLSDDKDITSWLIDVKIPDVTYTSSWTIRWGSDSSNYYSVTVTTDANGNAFAAADWITLKFDWNGASVTGTPDDTAIAYFLITVNYSASQANATSYKVDNIRLVRPEKLDFRYTSWSVGTNTGGTEVLKFGATTDIPYFSGSYDMYKFPVADYACAVAFRDLRLWSEADKKELDAEKNITRLKNVIPKSMTRETKSFKPLGVSFSRSRGRFSNGRFRV